MALTTIDGKPCDVLDAHGRLVVTPHALTLDGQTNVPADLRPGETLASFLARHVPGIESGAWSVAIGGRVVPRSMWARTWPHHGQLIACRAVVGKSVLQLIAVAVLAWFTMGGGATWLAGAFGVTAGGFAAYAIGTGLFMAGSMLINKVLGPKVPKVQSDAAKQVYSLSSQRNSIRPYEPLPVLWGEMRVTPDLASAPYTWFDGDDQYLSTILLGGINVQSAADLAIGDTPIASFESVDLFYDGFPGMASQAVPLYSNADSVAGGKFDNGGDWITRTSSAGTIALQVDVEGQLYAMGKRGVTSNSAVLTIETRPVGGSWAPAATTTLTSSSTSPIRRTLSFSVASGQYEVRAKLGTPTHNEGNGKDACQIAWTVLKSIQADSTDYSGWGRIGIKIKATGQLNGGLDTLRATYRAKPMPLWNGTSWATATTRATGLSNPGAIILQTLRGVRAGDGTLQFGFGLDDAQIDIEGIKAFMLHCTAKGYTYDRWITDTVSLGDFCQEVALAGMGEFSWTDGSRPTVVFVDSAQPISAVANMANMLKASFSVDYALSNAADGIEYQYVDRDRNWETQTLRVTAPGVVTMLNPARITGEGVTTAAHAAVMARYHLAQSLYQYKTIGYTADIEHLDYRRLSVLSLSHDLTQWAHGGRLVSAQVLAGKVVLTLDESVPPLPTPHVGLRLPGERDYRVWPVEALVAESNTLTLVGDWPAGVDLPGVGLDNPAHDTLWCYDFKATPGYRVRVVSMEPEADLKGARIACVPEGPEFWDYVLNGTYTPAPNQSAIPNLAAPSASNLRITERVNVQGDTEWYELSAIWDVAGAFDHAQVWAGRDGSELRMVDGNAQARSTFRINGAGNWLIQVRPFDASGRAGAATSLLYITTQVNLPPWNPQNFVVQTMAGGMRRFAWGYTSDRPAALAGVQIRYRAGATPAAVADWEAMAPLGDADDVYTAQFESTRPDEGTWTFALRAINTAGIRATSVRSYTATLPAALPDIQAPDLTPPPAPTGLAATAGLSTVMVRWDTPSYTQGHGHAHTEIWAGPTNVQANAAKKAEGYAGPVSFGSNPGQTWYIWARNVTMDGVAGPWSSPVTATTGQDVSGLLDVLAGQIGASELHQSLSARIDLVDGNGVGSVNERVNASAAALRANIDAVNAQVADIIGVGEYNASTAYSVGDLVQYQGKLYRAKQGTAGNAPTNTTYWELVGEYASIGEVVAAHATQLSDHETRIGSNEAGLTAEAAARNTLAAQLRGSYTGTDVAQLTTGLVYSERQARVSGDSANASAISAISARMPSGNGKVATEASVTAADSASVTRDNALASRATALEARMPTGTGQLATGAALTALETRVTSAEGGLTSQASNIASLSARISNAGGGPNKVKNPTFVVNNSVLPDFWWPYTYTGNLVTAVINGPDGCKAVRCSWSGMQDGAKGIASNLDSPMRAGTWYVYAVRCAAVSSSLMGQVVNLSYANAPAIAQVETISCPPLTAEYQWYVFRMLRTAGDSSEFYISIDRGVNAVNGEYLIATPVVHEGREFRGFSTELSAALQTEASVRASETGHLGGLYSVKMQLGQGNQQVVGGFALSGTSAGTAGPTIDFGVLANSFWIASPAGSGVANVKPFTVQTTAQTVNGVSVPAGVYMDAAYINNVTALWGRFGTLVADSVQATAISASQLTLGDGTVGGNLKSSNFVTGSTGWQLKPDGTAEFSGVTVRGSIYSTQGTIGGITINANGLNAGSFTGFAWPAGSGTGFHLGPNGLLLGNANTGKYFEVTAAGDVLTPGFSVVSGVASFSGALSAATGTFAGALSGATGSFNGSVTARTFTTVGGRFVADASGNVTADRVNILRRDSLATGSVYSGVEKTAPQDELYQYIPGGAEFTTSFIVDTGIDSWDAINFSINQPLHAIAKCTSSYAWWTRDPGSAKFFDVICSARAFIKVEHYKSGVYAPVVAPRIYVEITARVINSHPKVYRIRLEYFTWSLFKL